MARPSGSHRLHSGHLYWDIKVKHHTAYDGQLLIIFLAKEGDVRLDDLEEFENDRGYSAKVARAIAAAEMPGDPLYIDKRHLRLRIHLLSGGREDAIDASRSAECHFALESSRIKLEVR
jgi:hypothetical protein